MSVGLENTGLNSIEQATQIEQLLTPDGIKARFAPYITGLVVTEHRGSFFGKKTTLAEVQDRLKDTGFAVIEGGHRSGKTSLLQVIGERMVESKAVQVSVNYNLQLNYSDIPEQVIADIEEEIGEEIGYRSPKKKAEPVSALITFDEIEAYEPSNQVKLLKAIDQMRAKGHKIIVSVIGDLHGNSPAELPRPIKDRILEMAGNRVVINRLLDDEEMQQLLTHGDKPLFTEAMTRYLIAEAGGHPNLANLLASTTFELIKFSKVKPSELIQELRRKISRRLVHFNAVVNSIVAAGFNPLTWEWHGNRNQPNVEVYQNMIPRFTSIIFRDWLTDYLNERN